MTSMPKEKGGYPAGEVDNPDQIPQPSEATGGIRHHSRESCDGKPCPFHGPSLHSMIEEPMHLRASGLIERLCKHGVGHPDPDSVAFWERHGFECMGVHGCDGCCNKLVTSRFES